jgi:hypothetical protein
MEGGMDGWRKGWRDGGRDRREGGGGMKEKDVWRSTAKMFGLK